jgi:P4 family phage/plasmid primase-like protien
MNEGTERLTKELWDIINANENDTIELRGMRSAADRRGRVKRMLCNAIDKSSVGEFNGAIYYFGGKVYVSVSRKAFERILYDIMAQKMQLRDCDLNHLSDIYYDCLNHVYSKQLQTRNDVMIFRNGVLDLECGVFHRKFDKRLVQMWSVDYDYNPKANTFLWYQFINQVLPDKNLQDVLQMFLGATFVDRQKAKIEHIVILLGHGANGKSVVQQTVKGVLGEDYVSEQSVGRLCKSGNDGDFAVAEINGKRLNYCTEMEVTDFYRKTARLKTLVSGEKTTARRLYGMPYYATHIPLLMANANQVPIFNKKDEAMLRRIYVIPFNVTIPEEKQNKSLSDELVAEYPAILNWILEGRRKFIENGYKLPPDLYLEEYVLSEKSEYNSALRYMDKRGYKSRLVGVSMLPQLRVRLRDLYAGYQRWCWRNNIQAYGKATFSQVLEDEGNYVKDRDSKGVIFHVYCGADKIRNDRWKDATERNQKNKAKVLWKDGVKYVFSIKDLAIETGAGQAVLYNLSRSGALAGYTKAYKEKACYDVAGCMTILNERHILDSDDQKEILSRIRKELKYHRNVYNQRCQYNNFPYRMYGRNEEQIEDDIIVVPDETTWEETVNMAKAAGLDIRKATRYKETPGAFGRGGKGFFDSVDDIPTAKEKKSVKR